MRWRRTLMIAALLLASALLLALGSWQLFRREWKHALIARVSARVSAPAVPLASLPRSADRLREDWEYRHVAVTCTADPTRAALVAASTELGAGDWLLVPCRLDPGPWVLVNLGFVDPQGARRLGAPGRPRFTLAGDGRLALTGLLRLGEPGGTWLRPNHPEAERWYARDVAAIAQARGLPEVLPCFIDADRSPEVALATPRGDEGRPLVPVGGLTVLVFPDNHLVYALTWYALALGALAGVGVVVREERRPAAGRPDEHDEEADGQQQVKPGRDRPVA